MTSSPPPSSAAQTGTWTCPFCDAEKTIFALQGDTTQRLLVGLKNHIQSQVGEGHGARFEYPPNLDRETLTDYVTQPEPVAATEADAENEWESVQEELTYPF